MWNQVSTHYELHLSALPMTCKQYELPGVVRKQRQMVKMCCLSMRQTQQECQSTALQQKNGNSWKVGCCPISLKDLPIFGPFSVIYFTVRLFYLFIFFWALYPITLLGKDTAPVTGSQSKLRILIGQKWPICDPARGQTLASWRTGSYKGQIMMHLG